MQHLSEHIKVFQSAYWQVNSILCKHEGTVLVWDAAYTDDEIDTLFILAQQSSARDKYLIFTHGDFDHIVGNASFAGFQRVGSERLAEKHNKPEILDQVSSVDHEYYIERMHVLQYPELELMIPFTDHITERLGSLDVVFYSAPGHTPDGLFSVLPDMGLWITGDYLSDIEFPFLEDDIHDYYKTLDKAASILNQYKIEFMIPGHGSVALSHTEISSRIEKSFRYLESLSKPVVVDWRSSWGHSPFVKQLDKMHLKNIEHVRSQGL